MPNLEQTLKKHAPYLGALCKVTEYMKFFCGRRRGEPPHRRVDVSRCLVAILSHICKMSSCPACNLDLGLHEAESAFLAAYAAYSALDEYGRWLRDFRIRVCISDADDEEAIEDPLAWVAIPLAAKRANGIVPRYLRMKRRVEEEEARRPNRPHPKSVHIN